jgi:dTDP-4-amino-4,6-dideoxygalactose transaminase
LRAARQTLRLDDDPRARLERTLRVKYAAREVVLCGSGREALALALRVVARRRGEAAPIVALPAFTCFSVAAAAVCAGARITLYDLDPASLAPDLDSLRGALESGARIVVASPLFGIPIEWGALEECAASYGVIAIEDAALGSGAEWRGRPLGAIGEISVLSFGRGKGWTGGHGGALLARLDAVVCDDLLSDEATFAREACTLLSAAGQYALGSPSLYALPASLPWLGLGRTVYREPRLRRDGAGSWSVRRMTRAAAALVESTSEETSHEAERRRERARILLDALCSHPHVRSIRVTGTSVAGFLRFPVRASRGLAGFAAPERALRLGVAITYPTTLAAIPQVRARLVGRFNGWTGAEELVRRLITLPTHSRVSTADHEELLRMLDRYSG